MVVVAVAGGTGKVGRTLVEAIVEAGKHDVRILARNPNPALEAELRVPIITVDYSNIEALTKTLEDNNVHTVVSAIIMFPGNNEIELIRAANASNTTKRMISSDWGLPHTEEHIKQLDTVGPKFEAHKVLEQMTGLETTYFLNGFFMDFWGVPAVKSHMSPVVAIFDIPNDVAAIPGSGNVPVVLTHTTDIAKFVAASLDLGKWDRVSYVIGDRVTWNEFLHYIEEAKGTKFNVTHDSIETLRSGKITELPGQVAAYHFFPKEAYQHMMSVFGLWFAEGVFDFHPSKTLNELFPDIKTMKVKDMVNEAWKKS
ncbi:hypothetical protein BKA64DRAFT_686855 [Cadophora sp. MPI-SDFR-AT-0126]|nr:hypothetical protein BKA64DRAFT_686855 [Leotiomycetes sp. MPI-SDFR-AT-0126]